MAKAAVEESRASAVRKTAEAAIPLSRTPKRCASATRPPIAVPTSAPAPKSASTHGTEDSASPATSVRSGAM